jgi:hypothetical protein
MHLKKLIRVYKQLKRLVKKHPANVGFWLFCFPQCSPSKSDRQDLFQQMSSSFKSRRTILCFQTSTVTRTADIGSNKQHRTVHGRYCNHGFVVTVISWILSSYMG